MIKYKVNINLKKISGDIDKYANLGLQDCVDDLVRTSSQSAPHDEGILEKSWSKEVTHNHAVVSYSVKEKGGKGNFNYALKMHEGPYKLGPKSRQKTGGVGMSGKQYPVGPNFLAGVLKGEEQTYKKHIETMVKSNL